MWGNIIKDVKRQIKRCKKKHEETEEKIQDRD